MKSYYKKLAVSALAATMILPIAACNKKEEEVPEIKSGMEITAGTPWYEAKHITVDSGIDRTRGRGLSVTIHRYLRVLTINIFL